MIALYVIEVFPALRCLITKVPRRQLAPPNERQKQKKRQQTVNSARKRRSD